MELLCHKGFVQVFAALISAFIIAVANYFLPAFNPLFFFHDRLYFMLRQNFCKHLIQFLLH